MIGSVTPFKGISLNNSRAGHLLRQTPSCGRFHVGRSNNMGNRFNNRAGQAALEFTLVFLLFLVITWIPADFGLAFFTGQLAQNASREAARIAAADPNLTSAECYMPCSSAAPGSALKAAGARVSQALLPGALISVSSDVPAGTCTRFVKVSISGDYKLFFYRLLQGIGVSSSDDVIKVERVTVMRWEHQSGC